MQYLSLVTFGKKKLAALELPLLAVYIDYSQSVEGPPPHWLWMVQIVLIAVRLEGRISANVFLFLEQLLTPVHP